MATSASAPGGRKQAIRDVLARLADLAETAGLTSAACDVRDTRIPKLDDERISLAVLGEFNRGKSTLVNALLGEAVLPIGITPTTAVLTHVRYGDSAAAAVVFEDATRQSIDPARLGDWLTVERAAASTAPGGVPASHVELDWPAPFLKDGVTIIDTPGVNDLSLLRADITYGTIPRADAALFLLDATQILTASERRFLEERVLRSVRDRLIFVVTKIDRLDAAELDEALRFCRTQLLPIIPEAPIFPVSAKRALGGDAEGSRLAALVAHMHTSLGAERRRLVEDHALAEAQRLSGFVRQSLGMRRRSAELATSDLEDRVTRARARLLDGTRAFDQVAATIKAETAAHKARVRQDLAAFTDAFAAALPGEIDAADAGDVQEFLGGFLQDTWQQWLEAEGEMLGRELEALAEKVIEVASEHEAALGKAVADELEPGALRVAIKIDTFRYDASVFALGALGTTVFLFVNTLAGGLLTLATPILALLLKGKVAQEVKTEARQRAPEAVRRAAAAVAPKLDEIVDGFAARLQEFVAQAGAALGRGLLEVLEGALHERRARDAHAAGELTATSDAADHAFAQSLADLRAVDERIADIRQAVWQADG